ncbi:MAG: uracil-DNA glycosylase [Alphaproteobacteria bacterium]|nr:uracil-DNA glycosylase [Alphaproteobacteria bacterium]
MNRDPEDAPERAVARAVLSWYLDAGVDEAILAEAVDRTQPRPVARPPAVVTRAANPAPAEAHPRDPISRQPISMEPPAADTPLIEAASAARKLALAARDLDELEEILRGFEGCPLKVTATNTVFADGTPGAPVMFVGEAPGADEDREGKPFVGVSGRLLDQMLASIGFDRAKNAYIANILPWRPPGNRQPTPAEVAVCLPFVQRHIELAAPKILVLIGGTSAKTLLDRREGIMRLRGRWFEWTGPSGGAPIPTISTYHPAFLLRSPAQKANAWKDLVTLKQRYIKLCSD